MITRTIRLLLAGGFLAAVAHVAPVAERAALGITRPPGTTLDRIDGSKGYYKDNCRWRPMKDQSRNRSDNRIITAFGRTQTLVEWAEEFSVGSSTLAYRMGRGLTMEQAIAHSPHQKINMSVSHLNET